MGRIYRDEFIFARTNRRGSIYIVTLINWLSGERSSVDVGNRSRVDRQLVWLMISRGIDDEF